jgi:murein hydrolase activator
MFIMKRLVLVTTLAVMFGSLSAQKTKQEIELEKRQAENEIQNLSRELENIKGDKRQALRSSAIIDEKMQLTNQVVSNIDDQIKYLSFDIEKSENEIRRLSIELDTLKAQYSRSLVFAYKNRSNYDFLNFIFSSDNFNDAVKRVSYMRTYRDYQKGRADNIVKNKSFLQEKIEFLKGNKKQKSAMYVEQEAKLKQLEQDKGEKDKVLKQLSARSSELSKLLKRKQRNIRMMQAAIQSIINEEKQAVAQQKKREEQERKLSQQASKANKQLATQTNKKNTKTDPTIKGGKRVPVIQEEENEAPAVSNNNDVLASTTETKALSASFSGNKGRLPFPVDGGKIVLAFGNQFYPGTTLGFVNPGVTIQANIGNAVRSVFDGEVSSVLREDGMYSVLVRHGKYITCYSNLQSVSVSKGSKVTTNQAIGTVGNNDDGIGEVEFVINEVTGQRQKNINPDGWIRRK